MKKNGINIIITDEPEDSDTHLWESGQLGDDPEHAVVSKRGAAIYDEAMELQLISIRLPKELIAEYKKLGSFVARGYQPLMRDALRFYIEHNKSAIRSTISTSAAARKLPAKPKPLSMA